MITAQEATVAAERWVRESASEWPGFKGAFLHGSIAWLPDGAALLTTSDVDVILVTDDVSALSIREKHRIGAVVLDVSPMALDDLPSPEAVLGQYHLAGSFWRSRILADTTGHLTEIGAVVSERFAERRWVISRCEHARGRALCFLGSVEQAATLPEAVTGWLFGTGVLTHILLTAGLRNPTVRTRYLAVRQLLADYGRLDDYEVLLDLLGCSDWNQEQATAHLDALIPLYKQASVAAASSTLPFAPDISDDAYAVAIEGSRELIRSGDHREAVFWIVATYCRCLQLLASSATGAVTPHARAAFEQGFRRLLADLGITTEADLRRRAEVSQAAIPRVWEVAEAIMAANPEITGWRRATPPSRANG